MIDFKSKSKVSILLAGESFVNLWCSNYGTLSDYLSKIYKVPIQELREYSFLLAYSFKQEGSERHWLLYRDKYGKLYENISSVVDATWTPCLTTSTFLRMRIKTSVPGDDSFCKEMIVQLIQDLT